MPTIGIRFNNRWRWCGSMLRTMLKGNNQQNQSNGLIGNDPCELHNFKIGKLAGYLYRNANVCHGANDKGEGEVIPQKGDCDSDGDIEIRGILLLKCSDGVSIDAEPFKKHSHTIRTCYMFGITETDLKSTTLAMVKVFLEGRSEIKDNYADETVVNNKLKVFNSKFLQDYRSHAIELVTAAFDLQIVSLIYLMIEEVDNLFTNMEEDEVYNFFLVNLKEYNDDLFELMKKTLFNYYFWVTAKWDYEILKLKFHEYKLQSFSQRRRWLIAHFAFRDSHEFRRVFDKESADEDRKIGSMFSNKCNPI